MTDLRVEKGDITNFGGDAIVNAANAGLLGGGGVDGAIHRAGGPAILEECRGIVARLGPCRPGEAVVTTGGDLIARYVIHTVGPVWSRTDPKHADTVLASCYRSSMALAVEKSLSSIAFPNVGTGAYGFPKPRASRVALETIRGLVDDDLSVDQITFYCFDVENYELYSAAIGST